MANSMRRIAYLLIIFALFITFGCKEKKASLPAETKSAVPDPTAKQVAPATAQPSLGIQAEKKIETETYTYDARDRRDPFTPLILEVKEKPQRKKGASPMEDFDVEEIKLIAIAWDSKQAYAMITLPDRKSYTIRKGMPLGLYGGRVEEITRDSVIIREQVRDYKGQMKTKDTILKLRKEGD